MTDYDMHDLTRADRRDGGQSANRHAVGRSMAAQGRQLHQSPPPADMDVIRSTVTGSPTTGADMRLFVLHHPEAKRLQFSVSSRWATFKSFTTLDRAIAWFEAKALEWA